MDFILVIIMNIILGGDQMTDLTYEEFSEIVKKHSTELIVRIPTLPRWCTKRLSEEELYQLLREFRDWLDNG